MRKISHIIIFTLLIAILSPIFVVPSTALAQAVATQAQTNQVNAAETAAGLNGSSVSYPFLLSDGSYYADGYTYPTLAAYTKETSKDKPFGLECSINPFKFDLGACVALMGYYFLWYPTAALLMLAAAIFDTMAAWSFNADILRGIPGEPNMVSVAWGMLRNLADLALIFALLYIAIATILQIGGVQLKKAVANVVIVALLINFSFFITEVVIDASNVLASSLYSKIVANSPPGSGLGPAVIGSENLTTLQISARIVSVFDIQKVLTEDIVKAWDKARNGKSSLFFVFVFAAAVNVIAAYAFLKAGLLLVGRLVMFVFLIISSPIAFAAWALPGGGGGFDKKWWSALVDQALVAPVFFLFLYVITSVYSSALIGSIIKEPVANIGFIPFLVNIALHFVIVIVALLIAVKVTTKLSGAAGSYATKIGGAALLGTAAYAGRQTLGRGANALRNSKLMDKLGDGAVGRTADRALGAIGSGTMDLRGIPGVEGMGRAGGKGGFKKSFDATQQRKEGFANRRMNAIDPKTGKSRGDTQVNAMEYATDKERMGHWEKQQAYDVAMVKTYPAQMKAYEAETKTYSEKKMGYDKEMAEFSSLPIATQQKRTTEGRAPVKPVEPKPPKAPEKPAGFTLSARERLARQHEKSWSSSSKAAADNIRKGKGGGKSKAEKLAEAAAEYEKERGELSGETTKKEPEKPNEA